MVNGRFRFRAVGPGLDFAEWCDDPADLDGVLERMTLAVQKFKRDAEVHKFSADYDALLRKHAQRGGV